MKRKYTPWIFLFVTLISFLALTSQAQQPGAGPGIAEAPSSQAISSHVLSFSDTVSGQPDGALTVTFAIYGDQQGSPALWNETQVVQITQGKYTVLLGSTSSTGLPSDVFSADQAHWLGVQVNGTERRYLLVSVPYAMKAVEAETLGGLLPSQFVTVSQLQTALNNAATTSSSSSGSQVATGVAAQASSNPPQPATDFTDNNASEVLLVTQQGTGFAVHAISAGDAAVFGENSTSTGTGLRGLASSTTGANIGILGTSASPQGIAGVFDNTGGGKILSLRSSGNEVAGVDNFGNLNASEVQAFNFVGGGFGLSNIPNSATTATSSNVNNAIVARDPFGNFSAGQIQAFNFVGGGYGLTNIPNSATTASSSNSNNSIVSRDQFGNFSAGQIQAFNFVGGGYGLTNIPNSATTATPGNVNSAIVARDPFGNFSASQIQAFNFIGGGFGLTNIPNSATTATEFNFPSTIVARDASGGFLAGFIQASSLNVMGGTLTNSGQTDFSNGTSTSPVRAVLSVNTPSSCQASREFLVKLDATPGQQLFICNPTGNGYVLVGDGSAAGVTSVGAGDGSVAIGGSAAAPTVAVANGGITSVKLASGAVASANLAPNAVTSVNIADGSLPPAKINGTAATLGANTFTGTQTMPAVSAGSLTVSGNITGTGGGSISGSTFIQTAAGTALSVVGGDATNPGFTSMNPANGGIALQGTSLGTNAVGVLGRANGGQSVAGLFVNTQGNGRIISAGVGSGLGSEVFSVDTAGNLFAGGSLVASFPGSTTTTTPAGLAKLDVNGFAVSTAPGDTTGAVGVVLPLGGSTSSVRIAYGGTAFCVFDSAPHIGDYVQISRTTTGECSDVGPTYPASGQVIGRVTGVSFGAGGFVLLSGPSTQAVESGVGTINTGSGLTGGPITSSGTISIANGGVTNAMLQNNSVIVSPGLGLSGGGTVPLGGSVTLNNAGALSFNGRTGSIVAAPGDYSFDQIAGTASSMQLPAAVVYNNQSNVFGGDQIINGGLTTNSLNTTSLTTTSLTANSLNSVSGLIAGSSSGQTSVLSVTDNSAANNAAALSVSSANNQAAFFFSVGPNILSAGTATHNVLSVTSSGISVVGNVSGTTFSGDGSALTNVNASSLGGTMLSNLATASALNAETAARQSGDTTLQNNINNESSARQSADTTLQTNINNESTARQSADAVLAASISAETAARQSDVSNLQTNINNVSAGDAKLTASNTFTAGTQDFSGAGATLPVRALLSTQTPASCVAGKELLIKTDAPAGQQLFICDAGGTTWNLVGDGASGGVTSFNGRNGSVSPGSGDYSFSQVSGSVAASQLPAFTGDVTAAAGTGVTLLSSTGVVPGAYSKVSVDEKGRVVTGSQAAFSDLAGSASQGQLPVTVVYNNQPNTFNAGQTVNGNMTATAFIGNGGGLSNVNAAMLNNLTSTSFAQLGASSNTFTGSVTAASFSGNGSALTSVNAATVNNFQMLKFTASITPASVSARTCNEQSFIVSGVNSGDVLLGAQITTHSPGTNIAIGGARVSGANTVAIQFCNVSGSNSTPAAGTYTFALLR